MAAALITGDSEEVAVDQCPVILPSSMVAWICCASNFDVQVKQSNPSLETSPGQLLLTELRKPGSESQLVV